MLSYRHTVTHIENSKNHKRDITEQQLDMFKQTTDKLNFGLEMY